jgi:hypothetical protein
MFLQCFQYNSKYVFLFSQISKFPFFGHIISLCIHLKIACGGKDFIQNLTSGIYQLHISPMRSKVTSYLIDIIYQYHLSYWMTFYFKDQSIECVKIKSYCKHLKVWLFFSKQQHLGYTTFWTGKYKMYRGHISPYSLPKCYVKNLLPLRGLDAELLSAIYHKTC